MLPPKTGKLIAEGLEFAARKGRQLAEEGVEAAERFATKGKKAAPKKTPAKTPAKAQKPAKAATPPAKPPKPKAPAIIAARSGTPEGLAQDILREAKSPSKGALSFADWRAANPDMGKLFDLSNLDAVPDVPQIDLLRYEAPRGPSSRIVETLDNPEVQQGITEAVKRGASLGGKRWYNTDPLRQRMLDIMPLEDVASRYGILMDTTAATSPRARVPDNIRTASYYNYLRSQGEDIPNRPAAGYGSIAQNLHRDNVRGLLERGGWDLIRNPKPPSFSVNLQGNQRPVTVDTHNVRLPAILSRDPRMLETSVKEVTKDRDTGLETLLRQYPDLPQSVREEAVRVDPASGDAGIIYRPQEWVEKGYISMDDAAKDPGLWVSKPRDNEYGYYEKWQQKEAEKLGMSPAQYQASMWLGGGETTGLGSPPEPFLSTFEARVRYTADRLGLDPETVLDMMLKGEIPLLAKGGPVKALAAKYKCDCQH